MDINNTTHDGLVDVAKTLAGFIVTTLAGLFGGWMWSNATKVSHKKYEDDQAKLHAQLALDRAQLAVHNNELSGLKIMLTSLKEHMDEGFHNIREDLRHLREKD